MKNPDINSPVEEALVQLDISLNKLDGVVSSLISQLNPICNYRDNATTVDSPEKPASNSKVVEALKEYQRRTMAIMTHVAVVSDALEI
jgi:hypothetical protein